MTAIVSWKIWFPMTASEIEIFGHSLHRVVYTLEKIIADRYQEEARATEQITDKDRLKSMLQYLRDRQDEEEKVIADFKCLCKRLVFEGKCETIPGR